jgi:tetratricopeptide (TPR) repeat protein
LLFYLAGDPEHAIERHERALALNPRYTAAQSALGYAIERVKGVEAALTHWQAVLARDPEPAHPNEHAGAALDIALALGRTGDADGALTAFDRVKPEGRYRQLADRERMLLLGLSGRTSEAEALRDRLSALSPKLHELLVRLRLDVDGALTPEAVRRFLDERESNYNLAEIHLYLGLTYAAFGTRRKAESEFARALAADFDLASYHVQMGRLLGIEGDEVGAAGEFGHALAIDPDHVRARIDLGYELAALGRTADAIVQFSAGARIAPDYPDLHYQLGLLYAESQEPAAAEASFLKAIELNPKFALARASLALLYTRTHREEEALEQYERAIAIGLKSADIYLSMALIHLHLGNKERAIDALRRGAQLNPRYAPIHYHLGRIFQERGQRTRAYAAWRRFFHYAEEASLSDRLALFHNDLRRARQQPEENAPSLPLRDADPGAEGENDLAA